MVKAACISHDGNFGAVLVTKLPVAGSDRNSPKASSPSSRDAKKAVIDGAMIAVWKVGDKKYVGKRSIEKTVASISFNPYDNNFVAVTGSKCLRGISCVGSNLNESVFMKRNVENTHELANHVNALSFFVPHTHSPLFRCVPSLSAGWIRRL